MVSDYIFNINIVEFYSGLQKQNETYAVGENGKRGNRPRSQRRSVCGRCRGKYANSVVMRSAREVLVTWPPEQAGKVGIMVTSAVVSGISRV